MESVHPQFGRAWAQDQVRAARMVRELASSHDSPLAIAAKSNRLVRIRLAEILALKRDAPHCDAERRALPVEESVYDDYLQIERAPVTKGWFAAQAVTRTSVALMDLEMDPIAHREYASALALLPDEITTIVHDTVLAFNLLGR
ncbi:hypothetical protein AB0E59_41275 [Lentzea sp. NPDC034063]|uniref:hypothetical protein n=1 Tax=unclassified Lentzea TaxID=2643253 RepID=UPI0033E4D65E